jgi:WD40 repeat protein
LWSPDSRHVLTVADFQIHLTVWSLLDRSSKCIKNPKFTHAGISFSSDGLHLAVAHRQDCKDFVGVYSCETWEQLQYFQVETRDLVDLWWSADGSTICVQESELEYILVFYSIDGRRLSRYQAYEDALGVKTVSIASGGHLIAIGSYDEKVRLLNTTTWKPVTEFEHKAPGTEDSVCVYDEVVVRTDEQGEAESDGGKENVAQQSSGAKIRGRGKKEPTCGSTDGDQHTHFVSSCVSQCIPNIRPDPTKPNPRMGVGLLSWSADCRYLLSRNDNMPNTLWIWRMDKLKLAAVVGQINMVRSARWSPTANVLAVCTGNAKLYLWSAKGVSWIDVPTEEFEVKGLRWCPTGDSVALLGKSHLCCCYFDSNNTSEA